MGLGRAAFDHDVAGREGLVFRCFQNSRGTERERPDPAQEAPRGSPRGLRTLEESPSERAKRIAVITDAGVPSDVPRALSLTPLPARRRPATLTIRRAPWTKEPVSSGGNRAVIYSLVD